MLQRHNSPSAFAASKPSPQKTSLHRVFTLFQAPLQPALAFFSFFETFLHQVSILQIPSQPALASSPIILLQEH
jgi:hypothetical protein